jgi:hypothetical protein
MLNILSVVGLGDNRISTVYSSYTFIPPRADQKSFFGHPCLRPHIPSFQGLWLDFHQRIRDHAVTVRGDGPAIRRRA